MMDGEKIDWQSKYLQKIGTELQDTSEVRTC